MARPSNRLGWLGISLAAGAMLTACDAGNSASYESADVNENAQVVENEHGHAGEPWVAESSGRAPDAMVEIMFRGEPRMAAKYGETLVIEDDIIVGKADLAAMESWNLDELAADRDKGVRVQGLRFKWPSGRVPYLIDQTILNTAGAAQLVRSAMDVWEKAVPGLKFVAKADTDNNWVRVMFDGPGIAGCGRSNLGRQGGEQLVVLDPKFFVAGDYCLHHELGHTIGVVHEQSRSDRDRFISVRWNAVKSCPETATKASDCGNAACAANPLGCGCTAAEVNAGTCDLAGNMAVDASQANILGYDYDSVMHYKAKSGLSKCVTSAGAAILCDADKNKETDPGAIQRELFTVLGAGSPGQRNHLSVGDEQTGGVLYPVAQANRVLFAGTGSRPFCTLVGRELDIAQRYSFTRGTLPAAAFPSGTSKVGSRTINTNALTPGQYTSASCQVHTAYWVGRYDYPNLTDPMTAAELTAAEDGGVYEIYSSPVTSVKVLNRGLVTMFF